MTNWKINKCLRIVLFLVLALVTCMLAACGGGGGGGGGAGSSKTVELKMASDAPENHMATVLNKEACEKIKELTGGRVTVQYYGSSQLGSYETTYPELITGSIDIGQFTIPDATDPRFSTPYLPYYATSYEEAMILYSTDSYMSTIFKELTAYDEVRFLGWVFEGFDGMGMVTEPTDVFTPGTPKGVKVRSPGLTAFRYMLEDLGYNPITVAYSEVPTAIQTKVVDGWLGGTLNMNYAWVGDVINRMYITYANAEATCYVISEKSLAKLSEGDRATVIRVFEEQSALSFERAKGNDEYFRQKLEENGVIVTEFNREQLKTNSDFVREKTWTRLADVWSAELIDGFRAELGRL